MNVNQKKRLNIILTLLLLWTLFGYAPESTLSAESGQELADKLTDYLTEYKETSAGVATIVVHEDDIIYKMQGYADIKEEIPVDKDTVFEWGSVSKILIWISVFQLVEDGKLDLATDITRYLPDDFRSKISFDEPVTLQHLMHHTAGFDDSYTDLMIHNPTKKHSLREALDIADIKQVFPPGQIASYSNYGAGLAAYIVEEVSGLDYGEYVRQHIFEPLDMTKTAIDAELDDHQWVKAERQKMQGYTADLKLINPNHYVVPMYPVGSVMGVAEDLQKLMQALLTKEGAPLFKQRDTMDRFFEPSLYYPETTIPRMANGLYFLPSPSAQVFGHGGNTVAFSASLYVDRFAQKGALVLTNMANESAFTLGIPEMIFGKYTQTETHDNLEDSSKWIGIYEPARVSRHGFSKVYGLFLRGKVKQSETHNLMMHDVVYRQLKPGVYTTEDDYSSYAVEAYSQLPQSKKVLSTVNSDLLYVPKYQHYFEWGMIILGGLSILLSIGIVIVSMIKIIRRKSLSLLGTSQHLLNVIFFINIIWIFHQTLSLTTYAALQPFLIANILYLVASCIISGYLLFQMKDKEISKVEFITVLSTVILCGNVVYWAFYY